MDYRGAHHIDGFVTVNDMSRSGKFPPYSGAFFSAGNIKGLDDGGYGETIIDESRWHPRPMSGGCRPEYGRRYPIVTPVRIDSPSGKMSFGGESLWPANRIS
jgi:hypothetical protein